MAETFDISNHMPKDVLMQQTWMDCLHWALGEPEIVARFKEETGRNWSPATTPAEKLIDEATGAGRAFVEAFVPWFNANVWGEV